MSAISNARIDYPHIPRPLLELLDFEHSGTELFPIVDLGFRDQVVAFLVMFGGTYLPDAMRVVLPNTKGVASGDILLGARSLYLANVNQFFKEYHDER
jgi:hypothetical protein